MFPDLHAFFVWDAPYDYYALVDVFIMNPNDPYGWDHLEYMK